MHRVACCLLTVAHVAAWLVLADQQGAYGQVQSMHMEGRRSAFASSLVARQSTERPSSVSQTTSALALPSANSINWPSAPPASRQWVASGHEFYACFLSVVGSGDGSPSSKTRALFFTSRATTRVIVELLRSLYKDTVLVTPGRLTRVDVPEYAALGRNDIEVPLPNVVYIHSDEIVSVYGYSHNELSSDAFSILPVESLGKNYVVASARNALNYPYGIAYPNPRSELGIVGIEDNTLITFKLRATSYTGRLLADSIYALRLQRGQVYQICARDVGVHVQPDPSDGSKDGYYIPWNSGPDCDLTGSILSSDKPIALFSGHERAASPSAAEYDTANGGVSRDHLIDQMPPLELLGTEYVVASSGQDATNNRPVGGDMVRVVSAYDGTLVTVNGIPKATLNVGGYYEFLAGASCTIKTSLPAMVVRYMQIAKKTGSSSGDPDMTVLRPVTSYASSYTLPAAPDNYLFTEQYLLILCDTQAITATRRNEKALQGGAWRAIPGCSYAYNILPTDGSQERIESTKPCYVETYGFGMQDSYSYPGGGDFRYIDSLFAPDIDFHEVVCGDSKELSSALHTRVTPTIATDTVLLYRYEWIDGDTSVFQMLDGIPSTAPLRLTPRQQLGLPIRFAPAKPGSYAARLRVWSSAHNDVFVRVKGVAIAPDLIVSPDTIDFGRVRRWTHRDSLFTIQNIGTAAVQLRGTNYSRYNTLDQIAIQDIPGPTTDFTLASNASILVGVSFAPLRVGRAYTTVLIESDDPDPRKHPLKVFVTGIGIEPNLVSTGYDFGKLRVGSTTAPASLSIVNRGNDSSRVRGVDILPGSDLNDFQIDLSGLPPKLTAPVSVGFENGDTAVTFSALFSPQSIGKKRLILRIHVPASFYEDTTEKFIYDTLWGEGVEPLVRANPRVIDFGTVQVQPMPAVTAPSITLPFTVVNDGSMEAQIDRLHMDHTQPFTAVLDVTKDSLVNAPLAVRQRLAGSATFYVRDEGDFEDTIQVLNDTRYSLYGDSVSSDVQLVILRAKVRTGPIDTATVYFDTITTCDPIEKNLVLHNPYPVEIHIDSIGFASDTGGFSIPKNFLYPINIAPDSTYPLHLQYAFPDDSLNGLEVVRLILYQRRGGNERPIERIVTAFVDRKRNLLTLHAKLPAFIHSASDIAPLRLPITIEGPRTGRSELDSWTLKLTFSNDLYVPYSVDSKSSIAIPRDPSFPLTWIWDQPTRTFAITATNVQVSDPAQASNDLLFTVLMRAFLTQDTTVTVTPVFEFQTHPCAYSLQPFDLTIPYANECGEATIRDWMRGNKPVLTITRLSPNPVEPNQDIQIAYSAAAPTNLHIHILNMLGEEIGLKATETTIGEGSYEIPSDTFPASGTYSLLFEARDPQSASLQQRFVRRILVTK